MKRTYASFLIALLPLTIITGCSTSTSTSDLQARSMANHTVKLMAGAEADVQAFRSAIADAESASIKSMSQQKQSMDRISAADAIRNRARESAGDKLTGSISNQLLADADYAATIDQAAAVEVYTAKVKAILMPLRSPSTALSDVQTKAAAMGQELPAQARHAETLAFIENVINSIRENRAKIQQAMIDAVNASQSGNASLTAPKQ